MEISKQPQIRNKVINRERESRETWMTGKQEREQGGEGVRWKREAPEGLGGEPIRAKYNDTHIRLRRP